MKVIAPPGLQCPMEENPREYVTDETPVEVPDTAYYARLVNDGSLIAISKDEERQNKKLIADS